MLVSLQNNWDRWSDLANSANNKSAIKPIFTSAGNGDPGDDVSSSIPAKFSGWNNKGMEQFNKYVVLLKKTKRYRVSLEKNYLELWQKMAAKNAKPKKKKRRREDDQVQAENNLFGSDNGGALNDAGVEDAGNPFEGYERIETV